MNFREFKEDHTRGYYQPTSNKAAQHHGGQLVYGVFFLVASLFKLAWALVRGIVVLFIMAVRGLSRVIKKRIASKRSRIKFPATGWANSELHGYSD